MFLGLISGYELIKEDMMKVNINAETVNAIQAVIDQNKDKPSNIRIYVAGMG